MKIGFKQAGPSNWLHVSLLCFVNFDGFIESVYRQRQLFCNSALSKFVIFSQLVLVLAKWGCRFQ